jgi:hypothetical protein
VHKSRLVVAIWSQKGHGVKRLGSTLPGYGTATQLASDHDGQVFAGCSSPSKRRPANADEHPANAF